MCWICHLGWVCSQLFQVSLLLFELAALNWHSNFNKCLGPLSGYTCGWGTYFSGLAPLWRWYTSTLNCQQYCGRKRKVQLKKTVCYLNTVLLSVALAIWVVYCDKCKKKCYSPNVQSNEVHPGKYVISAKKHANVGNQNILWWRRWMR